RIADHFMILPTKSAFVAFHGDAKLSVENEPTTAIFKQGGAKLETGPRITNQRVLHAYLLGRIDFDTLLALQRQMVYGVTGDRSTGVLILCEHPPTVSIGRNG